MKRSDILRTLADDPECKLEWEWYDAVGPFSNEYYVDTTAVKIALHLLTYNFGDDTELCIRLKPKLRRVYFNMNKIDDLQHLGKLKTDTHYADLDERGCGEIKEIEK